MGTPSFAVPALQALIGTDQHQVVAVFTSAPKMQGRGMKLVKSPIHILAESHDIVVYNPTTLRSEESYKQIASLEADIIIVVAYGFIIPKSIIESKKYGCLNIHPSKLPRFRGAAPLQRTIINGDSQTAVCIMQMDEGLDTGDIILQEDINLPEDITFTDLHDLSARKGAELLLITLDNIEALPRIKQSLENITYASKLTKEEGRINWSDSAEKIDRQIRGMNPWPGAYCSYNGNVVKILAAIPILEMNALEGFLLPSLLQEGEAGRAKAGTIIPERSMVICGHGALEILLLKKAGSSAMSFEELLRGNQNKVLSMDI